LASRLIDGQHDSGRAVAVLLPPADGVRRRMDPRRVRRSGGSRHTGTSR